MIDKMPGEELVSYWERAKRKSALVRKGSATVRQAARFVARWQATADDYRSSPPVLANSFPKSGTHLLLQIVQGFAPRYYGSFIASTPSISFRERSASAHLGLIDRIVPGESVPAHLFHSPDYAAALRRKNVIHFFIYRNFADVAVSEAYYLTYMNRWHRLHSYFAKELRTDDERIECSIRGVEEPSFPYDYPDIARRFERFAPWLECPDVCAVRYEDLMSDRREETVRKMAVFMVERGNLAADPAILADRALQAIAPERSHTYREKRGGPQLSERHRSALAELVDVDRELVFGGR
jgi:sulfotransferase 6B1